MATIKEIARKANVSTATVSKALNSRHDVSAETRRRILEIAKSHNFVPSASAKNLKLQRTENIGVIFCRESQPLSGNPFYSRVLEGIEAESAINNYNLVLHLLPNEYRDTLPKMIREKQVDGLILVGVMSEDFIRRLAEVKIICVLVDPKIHLENMSQVLIDNEHGAFQATQYLINFGHKRIGFISGDLERLSFNLRLKGYRKALKYNGIEFDERLIVTGGIEKGYDHTTQLLQLESRPTAIFSANDINAIFGYKAISDAGLKIPDDISVIGFDDIELSKISNPPLSTMRVYKEEMGSIAVRVLLQMMRNEIDKPLTTMIPIKLVERSSVSTAKTK
ncbi:MAG: LacI family DNA-binding transcriptional regulator [Calditrichaceae bacterium]|nr:LacI family DNA-binding transcriptional regulator [Calditrichaceae bacterium]